MTNTKISLESDTRLVYQYFGVITPHYDPISVQDNTKFDTIVTMG